MRYLEVNFSFADMHVVAQPLVPTTYNLVTTARALKHSLGQTPIRKFIVVHAGACVGSVIRQMELGGSHGSGPSGSDKARHHHGDLMAPSTSGTGARKG
jgi:hypothetical protein